MTYPKNILIRNIGRLYGINEEPYSFKKGKALAVTGSAENQYLSLKNGLIDSYGADNQCNITEDSTLLDAEGGIVMPTYIDSHTHIVFAASRDEEFVLRLKGATYEEIAESGGGILNSAKKLEVTSHDDLYKSAKKRLDQMIAMGTGSVEIKSGYGLTFDAEIKMLEVIKQLKATTDADIKATFLGAHAIPTRIKDNRHLYIDTIINKMLPYVAEKQLADYCDVFCDKGFYTVEETANILIAAKSLGLKAKIHANELDVSGGVQVGIAHQAISVDHLECTTEAEWKVLSESNTIPTLLPGTSFYLRIPYAEARSMIDYGLGVVLASDFNPGSTPSGSMHLIQSLGCIYQRMLPTETFNATTYNAAAALEIQDRVGSITVGKQANIQVLKSLTSLNQIPYYYGSNPTDITILKGKIQQDLNSKF